ncbi:MAG: PAS domain S-box protein, partial [Pirellulaceae bacterium]|nr:PAS domain S-box protein [Pirellulaceae bacterium]
KRVAELELAAQDQAFLAALVESSSAAIFSLRMDGTITHWNASAEQLFGYTSDEILGQNVRELFPPDRHSDLDEVVKRVQNHQLVRSFETVHIHRNGTPIHVSLSVSMIHNSHPKQMCSIVTDTRERRRLEERLAEVAEDERRSLGRDLHDTLAQQITSVGMLIASLRDELPDGTSASDLIEKLESNVHRMQKQVRTIMVGLLPVDLSGGGLPVALERLAEDTADVFQVPCQFVFTDDVPLRDDFVATQLFLIAREATHNAAKHARANQIQILLSDHQGIRVSISDDGIGMPSATEESPGMGLPIMRHRAGLIGAELRYETPAGGGTIVNCYLPLASDA